MRPLKALASLAKDEPLNIEERLEKLEAETERKLQQFEEALGMFKDLVVKLYDEKEQLKAENASLKSSLAKTASEIKETLVRPLTSAGEDFVELLVGNESKKPENAKPQITRPAFDPNTDEMARTIAWMRKKFNLPERPRPIKRKTRQRRRKRKAAK